MGQVFSLPFKLLNTTSIYYRGLLHYIFGAGAKQPYSTKLSESTFAPLRPAKNDSSETLLYKQHARIQLYNLASNFYLYYKPHYRKPSYKLDLLDNLRNVAVPGTGVPMSYILSFFGLNRLGALLFLTCAYPNLAAIASVHQWIKTRGKTSISQEYKTRLLAPNDWFNYWRLNCNIVGLHSYLNRDSASLTAEYDMENKWTFLEKGKERGVPVSPFLTTPGLVVKHRNEEGGMGIYFYKNATVGGDWILQERINNAKWVAEMLPSNAPLSTFRVITCSSALDAKVEAQPSDIHALSCVFRAGRAGAATDHDSILFDVDVTTGDIKGGTTNAHWYKLGFFNALTCPWRSHHSTTHHPDVPTVKVTGRTVPDISGMLKLVQDCHLKMCPHVPMAGWDVVFSTHDEVPICLLEVNLSCNFFRGSFDYKFYLDYVDDCFSKLQAKRLTADR